MVNGKECWDIATKATFELHIMSSKRCPEPGFCVCKSTKECLIQPEMSLRHYSDQAVSESQT